MVNGLIYDMIQDNLNNEEIICPICGERVTDAGTCCYIYSKSYNDITAVYHRACLNEEYDVTFPMEVLTNGIW